MVVAPARFAGGNTALGAGPAIRGSTLVACGNVSTYNLAFPAGATAGDLFIIGACHGWPTSSFGSGQGTWTSLTGANGSNVNGTVNYKVLDAADITRGYVTVTWSLAYFGCLFGVCFIGAPTGIRTFAVTRDGNGVTTESVVTGSSPVSGDYAILFALSRFNGTVTVAGNPGTALQTLTSNEASGVLRIGTLTAGGVVTETYNFSGTTTGQYIGIIIVQP